MGDKVNGNEANGAQARGKKLPTAVRMGIKLSHVVEPGIYRYLTEK